MSTKATTSTDRAIIAEAIALLGKHWEPSKVIRFIAVLPWDGVNYVDEREKLFADMTLDEICEQARLLEAQDSKRAG